MSQTLAVFGAGPALGLSVARRFGREGFRVALVARSRGKLDGYLTELAADGIEAAAFTADLRDPDDACRGAAEIEAAFGPVDVLEYSPGAVDTTVVPAREVTLADLEAPMSLRFRTPLALTAAVLPGMLRRGRGALLFAFGTQPRYPDPMIGNVGPPQAALLHHVHNLNASLADDGVYAGALLIGGLIEGSEIQRLLATGAAAHLPPAASEVEYPTVHPDTLAELYWDMYVTRDRVEQLGGPPPPTGER